MTALLDDARKLAAEARDRENNALGLWHEQQIKAHKRTLRELTRQSESLRTRFPVPLSAPASATAGYLVGFVAAPPPVDRDDIDIRCR